MREPIHVVTEDYEHYQKRRSEGMRREFKLVVFVSCVLLIGALIYQIYTAVEDNREKKIISELPFKCPMTKEQLISYMERQPDRIETSPSSASSESLHYKQENKVSLRFDMVDGILFRIMTYPEESLDPQNNMNSIFECRKVEGKWTVTKYYK